MMSKKKKLNGFQLKEQNKQKKQSEYKRKVDDIVYRDDILDIPIDKNEVKWMSSFTKLPYDIQKSIHKMFDENIIYSQRCHTLSHKTSITIDGVDVVEGWYGCSLYDGLKRTKKVWDKYGEYVEDIKKILPKEEYLIELSNLYTSIVEKSLSGYGIIKISDNDEHTFDIIGGSKPPNVQC